MRSLNQLFVLLVCAALVLPEGVAQAATTAGKPQVLFAITNSQSMDGDVSGAILTGSGTVSGLSGSSSPNTYAPTNGFFPPAQAATAGQAPYTVQAGSNYVDNSESRLNMAKQAISSILTNYLASVDFALEDYKTSDPVAYTTWVYYMSANGGFTFSKTPVSGAVNVANPCYGYASNGSISQACGAADRALYGGTMGSYPYMQIAASSDDADINDVLYAPNEFPAVFVSYGSPYPSSPFPPNYTLSDYENYRVSITYPNGTDGTGWFQSTPTNAGYIPYSSQVMYSARGFGFSTAYPSDLSASSGHIVEGLQTTGTNPSASTVSAIAGDFAPYLAPETSSTSTKEIKAVAGQSPMAGLLSEAQSYLSSASNSSCAGQYVVLLTDGLPTESLSGQAFPPLGTLSAQKYGVSATFNSDGSLASTNDQALQDAVDEVQALYAAGIKVYVVGLGAGVDASSNPVAAQTLTALAIAGGTGQFYPASSQSALQGALNTILGNIAAASSISAPVAPISLSQGSLVYDLTSSQAPYDSHVRAYAVSGGAAAPSASWDAVDLMTPAQRAVDLLSTSSSGQVEPFSSLGAAAFNLTPSPCVPSTGTIVSYVVDPTYTYTDSAGATCSYEAGRNAASPVGPFDAGNSAKYMGPPASASLLGQSGYVAYARAESSRTPQLLFSSSDGFLYSVNAQTGALMWAWMPRAFVPLTQNIGSLFQQAVFDGQFSVVDAVDASGKWASFIVGTAMSGAYHYALELDASGKPSQLVWDDMQGSATAPDAPAPLIVRQGSQTMVVYVTTQGASSTLVERPLVGGSPTSATLGFALTSNLVYDAQSGSVLMGDSSGRVWQMQVSGNASADAAAVNQIGTTIDSSEVKFLGEGFVGQTEYAWATGPSSLSVFSLGGQGWARIWGATTSTNSSSSGVQLIPPASSIPNAPVLEGTVLTVPDYTPATSSSLCGPGVSQDLFFDIFSGKFPNGTVRYANNGKALTGPLVLPPGTPFTPSVTSIGNSIVLFAGSSGQLTPGTVVQVTSAPVSKLVQWRAM